MLKEVLEIFLRNFPFIVRNEKTVQDILEHQENKVIDKRNEQNELIGVSIVNQNVILLLCVDEKYRNRGIGSELLAISENMIKEEGFNEIIVGAGFDYLMPGVPTTKRFYESESENLYRNIDDKASTFFARRGYHHSWNCNCFDMRFSLSDFHDIQHCIGDTIDRITYRWALLEDLHEICKCTDEAFEEFTEYYRNQKLYEKDSCERVLIAAAGNEVVGTLIIGNETEAKNLGSIGCTTVKPAYQGKHIAVNLVLLGTKFLKEIGLKEAYLGYTYTGLEHLYGYAGYKICVYYMMAKKEL